MNKEDIKYVEDHLPENEEKWILIKKLQDNSPITKNEKQYLLKILDYPTEGIEEEIRAHAQYGPRSLANAKAAHDMQKVLSKHLQFINQIKSIRVEE